MIYQTITLGSVGSVAAVLSQKAANSILIVLISIRSKQEVQKSTSLSVFEKILHRKAKLESCNPEGTSRSMPLVPRRSRSRSDPEFHHGPG